MSSVQRTGLLLLVVFSVMVGGAWQAADKPPAVQKWEYKEIERTIASGDGHAFNEKTANELGAQGWEMVAIESRHQLTPRIWFKRPKQ